MCVCVCVSVRTLASESNLAVNYFHWQAVENVISFEPFRPGNPPSDADWRV